VISTSLDVNGKEVMLEFRIRRSKQKVSQVVNHFEVPLFGRSLGESLDDKLQVAALQQSRILKHLSKLDFAHSLLVVVDLFEGSIEHNVSESKSRCGKLDKNAGVDI
jgi:hypothetical protein